MSEKMPKPSSSTAFYDKHKENAGGRAKRFLAVCDCTFHSTETLYNNQSNRTFLQSFFSLPLFPQPYLETTTHVLFDFVPTITTFRICTLLSCQAFSKNSGVFRLSCLSATLPEQFVIPPTSSWIQSASPQLLRNNALRTVCLCVHIHCGLSVSSTVDHMNIYHAVTSPPSYSALIITAELDHLSHRR